MCTRYGNLQYHEKIVRDTIYYRDDFTREQLHRDTTLYIVTELIKASYFFFTIPLEESSLYGTTVSALSILLIVVVRMHRIRAPPPQQPQ